VLGAVAYAASPWHFFHVLHLNRFPIGLVWALAPLPYYFFERRGPRPAADALLCAMSLALIVIAHTGYFLFATVLFTLYVLLRSLPFSASSREIVRDLLFLAGAGAATAALGAGFALPLLVEKDLVFDMPDLARGRFFFDQPTLASVLAWSRFPAGHSGYLGISIVLLGLLGAGRTLLSKPMRRLAPWTALLAVAAFLALGHGLPGYGKIPFVYSMFYAGRYLELVAFALAVLAGVGFAPAARGLERALGFLNTGPGRARALGVLLGLVLLDVGMAGFFRHPRTLWEGEKRIVYDVLARAASDRRPQDGFFRALDLTSPTSIFNEELAGNTVLPILTGAASPYG
ncbi:MAG: hypothetical protein K8I02_00790, partial [Candidatus Methylomirabilis sp.]|nr:hypothetical protein [Deltaproteobacteria bacterium]